MTAGPLNRLTGVLGLLALVPTAIMSATGNLTAGDTAMRAAATLLLVVAVRKVIGWYLSLTASALERQTDGDPADGDAEAGAELRRRQADFGTVAS